VAAALATPIVIRLRYRSGAMIGFVSGSLSNILK